MENCQTNQINQPRKHSSSFYYNILIILACIVYFTSYVTRYSYGIVKNNMIDIGFLSETTAGPIGSALFFAYGFGQIISGVLGDKIKPYYIILMGMCISVVCNFVFPLFESVGAFIAIWAINGFAQSMFWPPLVKILAEYLPSKRYSGACFWVLTACQIANIAMYLIVPLLLYTTSTWKATFYFAAVFALIATVVCVLGFIKLKPNLTGDGIAATATANGKPDKTKNSVKLGPTLISCGIITILLSIALHGYLKDGITSWFPTCISNTFHLKSEQSIIVSVIIPVISILGTYVITAVYRKWLKNELKGSFLFFAIAAVLAVALYFVQKSDSTFALVFTLILAALIVSLMHGINMMLISYVPSRFASMNCVSTVSGITNSFTYVGNTVSDTVIGVIEENHGFSMNVLTWIAIAALGAIACLFSVKPWTKFVRKTEAELESNQKKQIAEEVKNAESQSASNN